MSADLSTYTNDELLVLGMKCLVDKFGIVNAEQFINSVRATCPDYTLWRRRIYDDMTIEDVFKMAEEDAEGNPFERSFS